MPRRSSARPDSCWLFLLFFAADYQPSASRFPRKSWGAEGSANEKTARLWLFLRCFTEKTAGIANAALPLTTGFSAQIDGIRISERYH
jgi:hypothetical protein